MERKKEPGQAENFGEGLSPLELRAAQEVTLAFLMAVKNYGLFPPDHLSTINLLNNLTATLEIFLAKHGPLRLVIEKSHVRYEEEVVFEETNPDNNPAFIFFRDGILWLEFVPGLKPHELLAFFRIISRFKLSQEEPEGDLVTELWGCDFEHIGYQASDCLWEAEPILEFSLLNPEAQTVLEYGVVNTGGFDLLKSVLGSTSAVRGENVAGLAWTEGGEASGDPGASGGLGPGLGAGDGSGVQGGLAGGPGASSTPDRGGAGGGPSSALGGGGGAESAGTGDHGAPLVEEPDELDFWAVLRRVSPTSQGGVGLPGSATLNPGGYPGGAGGPGGGPSGGAPAGLGRQAGSGGMAVYTATGHIPEAGAGSGPGGAGRGLAREGNSFAPGSGGNQGPIAARKATAFSRPGRGGDWSDGEDKEENYISVNVASIEPGHSLWKFTSEEQQQLARMVQEHEEGDNNADIIELLLILLRLEEEPQILVAILAFLKEEFRVTLTNRRFDIGHTLLVKVNELSGELPPDKGWAQPLIARFFDDIVEPEILDSLTTLWPELPTQKPEVLQDFSAILRLLPPAAGVALVPLLPRVHVGMGRRILIDMIGVFASRDLAIIEKMLDRPEEDLLWKLTQILRQAPYDEQAEGLLLKALRHPKDTVRREVCEILMERDTQRYERIFQLIYDPSPEIRQAAFAYLGRERNEEVEKLLLAHLASPRFLEESNEHVTACYLALGLCGSDDSVPYLQRVLFGQAWNFMAGLGAGSHRQGAALALAKLRTRASLKLLREAEASAIPHIRKAWAKATGN